MDEHGRDATAPARRVTRRRQLALAGSAVVVLVLVAIAGVNVLRNDPGGPPPAASADAAAPGVSVPYAAPDATQIRVGPDTPYMAVPPGTNPPERPPTAAQVAAPGPGAAAGPLGPGAGDCADRQDPALRALVEEALPEVVGAPEAATTMECRPGGERRRRAGGGRRGADGRLPAARTGHGRLRTDARTAPTASGGTVAGLVAPGPRRATPAPFADRLDAVVAYLAPRSSRRPSGTLVRVATEKGERRRAALVAAAAELLRTGGFEAVRHRAVAEKAGLPLASTTYYFASLDDLVVAAVEHSGRGELAEVRAELEACLHGAGARRRGRAGARPAARPGVAAQPGGGDPALRAVRRRRAAALPRAADAGDAGGVRRPARRGARAAPGVTLDRRALLRLVALVDGTVVNSLIEADPDPRAAARAALLAELAP